MPEQKKVVIYRSGSVTSSTDYSSRAYISEDPFDDGDRIEVRSGGVAAETVIAEGGTMTVLSGGTVEGINLNTDGTFRGVGAYCSGVSKWYGPAICATNAAELTVEGGTFVDNAAVTSNNYAGQGGAIETYLTGALNVSGAYFAGNSATGGGGAILNVFTPATIADTFFLNNSATYGGAVEISGNAGATVVVSGGTMSGNSAGYGGALEVHSGASVRMENVLAVGNIASDGGAVMNDCYDDQASTLELVSGAYIGNTAFRGGAILNSAGRLSVSGGTYADNTARMGGAFYFIAGDSAVNISGTILTGNTAVFDATAGYNSSGMGGAVYIEDGATVTFTDAFVAGNTAEVNPENAWEGGCGGGLADYGNLTVAGGTMTGNVAEYGGALYVAATYGNPASSASVSDTVFSGNSAHYGGGAISNTFGELTVTGGTFFDNVAETSDGGAIANWYTATVSGASFGGNRAATGGAISNSWGQTLTVSDCRFTGNVAVDGGAIWQNNSVRTVVSDCVFSGNTAEVGGAIWNDSRLILTDVTLETLSDTVYNTGVVTITGTDRINASINGSGSITVSNANLVFGNAAEIEVANLAFTGTNTISFGSEIVRFTAQDLSGASLTVNGSAYAGSTVTVATGVTSIGDYTITDKGAYEHLALYVENNNLCMAEATVVPTDAPQSSFTGGTLNVMAGGTITGAYVGIRNPDAGTDVKNVVSGGTVGEAFIGGALVNSGSTATLGTVTVDLSGNARIVGGTANGGMFYAAGYAYGADESAIDATPTLTVAKSVLNFSAGSVPAQNLYAGAHARKGAYTVVAQTEINVTGGSFGRIYGGGWAEKNALSEVGSSTITVSGGVLDYIYAGGGHAEGGATVVTGAVNIAVSGDASVGIVFLAGKNINCTTGGAVTMTVSGDAKSMIRVSGWNANGKENPSLTTLELQTSLNVAYLDHVDVIRIAEGETLNVSTMLWYESGSAMLIDFDLDGDLDADWTAMSGAGMELYQAARYTFDGGATVYTWDKTTGKLGDSGYALDFSESRKAKLIAVANS